VDHQFTRVNCSITCWIKLNEELTLVNKIAPSLNKQKIILATVLLVTAVIGLYGQVGRHDFINFDDPEYVYANPYVQKGLSLASISWAFTATHAANWHPVTWLAHMLVVQLFALNPAAHHLVNVLLHAANTVLLLHLLRSLTGTFWRSAVVAALFALHPLHVESVAWIAELKDVLSTLFGLLTIYFYLWFVKQPDRRRYALVLVCFILGLMAKPMLVTLPVLLLLLDYWPLGRLGTIKGDLLMADKRSLWLLFREKIPLFTIATASCLITIYAQQHGGAIHSLADSPLTSRTGNALLAYLGYLGKTLWPWDLAILYPFLTEIPLAKTVAAGIMLAAITLLVILFRKRHPYLFVGWFWYICSLVPVIGIVRVGQQAMADRYTYLPLIGIFIALVFGAVELTSQWEYRRAILLSVTVVILSLSAFISWRQLSYWRNNETLYAHTLAVTSDNYLIHNNIGFALDAEGKLDEALYHYNETIRIAPWYAKAYLNRGITLRKKGQLNEAMVSVREAIKLNPDFTAAYIELGLGMLLNRLPHEAINYFQAALKLDPELADGYYNMGLAYADLGNSQQAIEQFTKALLLKPDDSDCHYYIGVELARQQRYDEAIAHFTAVMSLKPDPEMEQMTRQSLKRAMQQKASNP